MCLVPTCWPSFKVDTLCPDPLLLAEHVYAAISTTNMAVRDPKAQKVTQKTVNLACVHVSCAYLLAIIQGDLSSDMLCPDPLLLAEHVYAAISTTNMAVRDQKAQKVTKKR